MYVFIVANHAHTCAAPSGTLKQSSAIGCGRDPLRMFRYAFASSLVFLSLHSALNVTSEDSALGIGGEEVDVQGGCAPTRGREY